MPHSSKKLGQWRSRQSIHQRARSVLPVPAKAGDPFASKQAQHNLGTQSSFKRNLYDPSHTRSPTSSHEHCHHLENDGKVEEKEVIAPGMEQIAAIREET